MHATPDVEPATPIWRESQWWVHPVLVSALFATLLYAITLGGTYIYDDEHIVRIDPRVSDVSKWKYFWTGDYWGGNIDHLYRPLVSQSYGLQWWLHGDRPWAFHLVNILLHAAVTAAVAELARRLAGRTAAWIAGLLFAVLPIHAEAVAGIVGRAELACTGFVCLSLLLFLHRPLTRPRAVAISLCALCAALSKEQGMLMPVLLLLLGWATRRQSESPAEKEATGWLIIGLAWPAAALIVIREFVLKLTFEWDAGLLDDTINPLIFSHARDRVLMVFSIIGRYAQLTLFPLHLSIDYGWGVLSDRASLADPYLYAGMLVTLFMIGALLFAWRRGREGRGHGPRQNQHCVPYLIIFCLLATMLTYGMVSNVLIIGTIFGERLMYLPSVFLLIALGMAVMHVPRKMLIGGMTVALLLSAVRLETYIARWNDAVAFERYCLTIHPRSVKLHQLLVGDLLQQNRTDEARVAALDGVQQAPDSWNTWDTAGLVYIRTGEFPKAVEMFQHALDIRPVASIGAQLQYVKYEMVQAHPRHLATATPSVASPATVPLTQP